jgi:hypothetical protein
MSAVPRWGSLPSSGLLWFAATVGSDLLFALVRRRLFVQVYNHRRYRCRQVVPAAPVHRQALSARARPHNRFVPARAQCSALGVRTSELADSVVACCTLTNCERIAVSGLQAWSLGLDGLLLTISRSSFRFGTPQAKNRSGMCSLAQCTDALFPCLGPDPPPTECIYVGAACLHRQKCPVDNTCFV